MQKKRKYSILLKESSEIVFHYTKSKIMNDKMSDLYEGLSFYRIWIFSASDMVERIYNLFNETNPQKYPAIF